MAEEVSKEERYFEAGRSAECAVQHLFFASSNLIISGRNITSDILERRLLGIQRDYRAFYQLKEEFPDIPYFEAMSSTVEGFYSTFRKELQTKLERDVGVRKAVDDLRERNPELVDSFLEEDS